MKKVVMLTLLAVVGFTANAALSIGGHDGEAILEGSKIMLSLDAVDMVEAEYGFYALITDENGTLADSGSALQGALTANNTSSTKSFFPEMPDVVWFIGDTTPGRNWNGAMVENIEFTCTNGLEPCVIKVVYTSAFSSFDEVASITINQIPEPATMALLALGGVFLRRRK